jgi:hypothetical protein
LGGKTYFLLGSKLGPVTFEAGQDPFPLGGKTYFLLRSKLDPATFEADQDPFPLGGRTRFFFFFLGFKLGLVPLGLVRTLFFGRQDSFFYLGPDSTQLPLGLDTT